MGEFSESDCWKKMILKRNSESWVANIKSEATDSCDGSNTTGFSLEGVHEPASKIERGEVRHNYCPSPESTYAGGLSNAPGNELYEPDLTIHELDPLLIHTGRRRRPSGGLYLKNETPEARAVRLARMSAYASQRIANETPEQRALRLKRMSEYAAKRLARESPEQRAIRLARMSEYAAKRMANETPEQRETRLKRMSAYAAMRQARKKMELGTPGTSESVTPRVSRRRRNTSQTHNRPDTTTAVEIVDK